MSIPFLILSEGVTAYNTQQASGFASEAHATFEVVLNWAVTNISCDYDLDGDSIFGWFYPTNSEGSGYDIPTK